MSDIDNYQTRFFRLDTRDTTGCGQIYYAAWRPTKTVLFMVDDNSTARVMWILWNVYPEEIRRKVQIGPDGVNGTGITDVVGFDEGPRPDFNAVDISQIQGRDDEITATEIGNILEAGYID